MSECTAVMQLRSARTTSIAPRCGVEYWRATVQVLQRELATIMTAPEHVRKGESEKATKSNRPALRLAGMELRRD